MRVQTIHGRYPWAQDASPAVTPVETSERRICAHEGCETVLSMYNPEKFCALHDVAEIPTRRGERKLCPKCRGRKPLTEFRKDSARRGGVRATCKDCDNERQRRYRSDPARRRRVLDYESARRRKARARAQGRAESIGGVVFEWPNRGFGAAEVKK